MPSMKLTSQEAKKLGVDQPSPSRGVGSRKSLPGKGKSRSTTRSKYRNVITEVDGVKFASKREASRWAELKLLQQAGKITGLELQPEFDLIVNGGKVCRYVADFAYIENAKLIVEDVKSPATRKNRAYRIKVKLIRQCLGIDVTEV